MDTVTKTVAKQDVERRRRRRGWIRLDGELVNGKWGAMLNYHFPGKSRVADLATSELAEAVKLAVDEASAPGASLEFEEEVAG